MEKQVVVTIPVYKSIPDSFEKASFNQVLNVLKQYDFSIFTYQGLDVSYYTNLLSNSGINYRLEFFDKHYFDNVNGYNKLLLSEDFYKRFETYQYILIYQLDAYVFHDELKNWCDKEFDYIGAPWFEDFGLSHEKSGLVAVGNGGLSLRRISSFLSVFDYMKSNDKRISFSNYWNRHLMKRYYGYSPRFIFSRFFGKSNTMKYFQTSTINEDAFWSQIVPEAIRSFKIASIEEALRFSFESDPVYLFGKNGNRLPFGCHAWQKNQFETFWSQYILVDK